MDSYCRPRQELHVVGLSKKLRFTKGKKQGMIGAKKEGRRMDEVQ